ncbi:Uncharacterized protein HZ326_13398 [Fusarium oxysporum f. sp. albedinis]|nr:Uncharacterized protein HZ326_13398 [Fusarium oxysporum f. sp. albedinis]
MDSARAHKRTAHVAMKRKESDHGGVDQREGPGSSRTTSSSSSLNTRWPCKSAQAAGAGAQPLQPKPQLTMYVSQSNQCAHGMLLGGKATVLLFWTREGGKQASQRTKKRCPKTSFVTTGQHHFRFKQSYQMGSMKYGMGLSRKETTGDENNTIAARSITA